MNLAIVFLNLGNFFLKFSEILEITAQLKQILRFSEKKINFQNCVEWIYPISYRKTIGLLVVPSFGKNFLFSSNYIP